MSVHSLAWVVVAVIALLGVSAFFSSTEIAVFSLAPDGIADRAAEGDSRAAALATLREDPHRLLVTLLVGNNVVNVAISSVITAALIERLPGGLAITAATLAASSVVLIFGEILPKAYGLGHADRWALRVTTPLRIVEVVLFPLVVVFDGLTRGASRLIGAERDIERPYTDASPAAASPTDEREAQDRQ